VTEEAPAIGEVGCHREALETVIARAKQEIPLYRDRYHNLSTTTFESLPTISKADLRGYGPLPLSAAPLCDMYRVSATSGTTGPRLFIGYTESDWQDIREQYRHIAACVGLESSDVLLNTHGGGLWIGAPSLDELAHAAGAGIVPCGPTGPSQVIEWLQSLPITAISATPSYMRLLSEHANLNGIELDTTRLRMGLFGGEGSSPSLRQKVCQTLGPHFRWQEAYGSTETGGPILAYAPPDDLFGGLLNVNTRYFVVEVLHLDRDQAIGPGEIGEITLSTPYRQGSVLLRYRTRDLARIDPGPRDASGWPRISALVGRIDDALKVRGTLVYPSAIEDVLTEALSDGAEWRIELSREVGDHDVMRIRYEHDDGSLDQILRDRLHDRLGLKPVLERVAPKSFERFPAKAKRVDDRRID